MSDNTPAAKQSGRPLLQAAHPAVSTTIGLAVLITALVVAGWLVYFLGVVTAWPYQIEYREGAPLVLTRLLLEGQNPFSLEHQPLAANNYGVLYNLSVVPVAAAIGNTLLAHRAVTVLFILLCFLLVLREAYDANRDAGAALVCGEIVIVGLAALGGLGAFPGTMGTFFFLAALLIPLRRAFDGRGMAVGAGFCVLAFYTKPYFVLALGILASYVFLFVSMRRAIWYAALFMVMLAATAYAVKTLFPLYFVDTFISNLTQSEVNVWGHVFTELKQLVMDFHPGLIAVLVLLIVSPSWLLMERGDEARSGMEPKALFLDRPLISRRPDFFLYAFVLALVAFVFVLALHTYNPNNALPYSYQLVVPPFFLWLTRKLRPGTWLGNVLALLLAFNLVWFALEWLSPAMLSQLRRSEQTWQRLRTVVRERERVLNSPLVAAEVIGAGRWPVDAGQTEFYFEIRDYPRMELLGPDYQAIRDHGEPYVQSIRAGVRDQLYDAVITTQYDWANTVLKLDQPQNALNQRYSQERRLHLLLPLSRGDFDVSVWLPNTK